MYVGSVEASFQVGWVKKNIYACAVGPVVLQKFCHLLACLVGPFSKAHEAVQWSEPISQQRRHGQWPAKSIAAMQNKFAMPEVLQGAFKNRPFGGAAHQVI